MPRKAMALRLKYEFIYILFILPDREVFLFFYFVVSLF